MHDQVFADGLGQISVVGGTVRLDFVTYSPVEKDPNGRPVAVFCEQIIMTVDAFIQAAEKMHEAAGTLSNRVANARPREPQAPAAPIAAMASPAPEPAPPIDVPKRASKPPFP